MLTLAGTLAPAEEESETLTPPLGAARARLTVPVAELPPITEPGVMLRLARSGTSTPRLAVALPPLRLAVIVALTLLETVLVLAVNVALVAPAGTVTVPGTVTDAELELSATLAPPGPAAPLSVTVPVNGLPPTTVLGESVKAFTAGASTVRLAVLLEPERVPVMVRLVFVFTATVVMANVALFEPAGTDTEAGTFALEELEDKVTLAPLGPAAPLNVTVPVAGLPPKTDVGETVTLDSVAAVMLRFADS